MATDDEYVANESALTLIGTVARRTGLDKSTVEDLFYNEWRFTERVDGTLTWSHSDWERLNNAWNREQGKRGRKGRLPIQEMDGQGQEDG